MTISKNLWHANTFWHGNPCIWHAKTGFGMPKPNFKMALRKKRLIDLLEIRVISTFAIKKSNGINIRYS